jgi:lysophospholipase L1-like esterase
LGTLLDQLLESLPDALLVVSTIIPFPQAAATVEQYNAGVVAQVQQRMDAGERILLVDQFDGFPTDELADGVHPDAAGYARMAGVWYDAISTYLK